MADVTQPDVLALLDRFALRLHVLARPRNPHTWDRFAAKLAVRSNQGAREYGQRSFRRSDAELVAEIREELLDVVLWSSIRWSARRLRNPAAAPDALDNHLLEASRVAWLQWASLEHYGD